MSAADARARAKAERLRRQELVRRRLRSDVGVTHTELNQRLGWPVGALAVLRELEELGQAQRHNDLWFTGPPPERLGSRVDLAPRSGGALGLSPTHSGRSSRPAPPEQKQEMRTLSDRVLADLAEHPQSRAPDIAARLGVTRPQVSPVLQALRKRNLVTVEGVRTYATWSLPSSSPPPAPAASPARSPRTDVSGGDDPGTETSTDVASLVDEVLNMAGISDFGGRRFRLGVLLGMVRQQRSAAS